VPDTWLHGSALAPERREQILAFLYGADWRLGNGDGSKYVVLSIEQHVLSELETAQRVWTATGHSCYAVGDDNLIERISPDAM
jgi:hypothetical protein